MTKIQEENIKRYISIRVQDIRILRKKLLKIYENYVQDNSV